jgi:glycosyltransferase involved in cell wall biosynthesis
MNPEVSAIIPTFNRRDLLVEAIESVLAQREVQFELIVVDDGSTDGTADAIEASLENAAVPVRVRQT